MKYSLIGGSDGWLRVRRDPSGEIISLPEFLQVEVSKKEGGRDYFKVLEGCEKGKLFSVKQGNLKQTSLIKYNPAASLTFSISSKELRTPVGLVYAFTDPGNKIPGGMHPIQIPDFPHGIGSTYLGQTPYAKNWFFLGTGVAVRNGSGNDRYLHTGRRSLGCVTVAPDKWTLLYKHLILCRSSNGTIGTIAVTP